eukprot:151847_1
MNLDMDDATALELLFESGVVSRKYQVHREKVLELEIFLLPGYFRIQGLQAFCNLNSLEIIGQDLETIEGLVQCPKLKLLDLSDNKLTSIGGLDHCLGLRELRLGRNRISKIKSLGHLCYLE